MSTLPKRLATRVLTFALSAIFATACCKKPSADSSASPSGSSSPAAADTPGTPASKPIATMEAHPVVKGHPFTLTGSRKITVQLPADFKPGPKNTKEFADFFDKDHLRLQVMNSYESGRRTPIEDLKAGMESPSTTGLRVLSAGGQLGVLSNYTITGDEALSWSANLDIGKDGYGHALSLTMYGKGKLTDAQKQIFYDVLATAQIH